MVRVPVRQRRHVPPIWLIGVGVLVILALLIAAGVWTYQSINNALTGLGYDREIVGKWDPVNGFYSYDFRADGTVLLETMGATFPAHYDFVEKTYIRIYYDQVPGVDHYTLKLDKGKMWLKDAKGKTWEYNKVVPAGK